MPRGLPREAEAAQVMGPQHLGHRQKLGQVYKKGAALEVAERHGAGVEADEPSPGERGVDLAERLDRQWRRGGG